MVSVIYYFAQCDCLEEHVAEFLEYLSSEVEDLVILVDRFLSYTFQS